MSLPGDLKVGDSRPFKEEKVSIRKSGSPFTPESMLEKVKEQNPSLRVSSQNFSRSTPAGEEKIENVISEAKKIADKVIAKDGTVYPANKIKEEIKEFKDGGSLEKFIDRFENLVDIVDIFGNNVLLFFAAEIGSLRVVREMVENFKASSSYRPYEDPNTPIIRAAQMGHLPVVQYLAPLSKYEDLFQTEGHNASLLDAAAFGKGDVCQWVVDHRVELKLPIAGSSEALTYILESNLSSVAPFLLKFAHITLNSDQSSIERIKDVTKAAYMKDAKGNTLLHHAVREGNAAMVDILLAAGSMPDAKNNLNETPISIAKGVQIKQSLDLCLEKHISFRLRQLDHLLKEVHSQTMTSSDEIISWATIIASIDENKQASKPLKEDLRSGLVKSVAFSFVIENSLFTKTEKEIHIDKFFKGLQPKEWILVKGKNIPGHHTIFLFEKEGKSSWKALEGDRFRHGGKGEQFADSRETLTDLKRIMGLIFPDGKFGVGIREDSASQKIKKKWQGAQNNCVTQSDTVAFEYLLAEQLGEVKQVYYRQIKPTRIMFLCSSLTKLNKLSSSTELKAWHWFTKPLQNRLSDMHPQILGLRQAQTFPLSSAAQQGESFLVAENPKSSKDLPQFSVWSHGSKIPTRRIPWLEGISYINQVPTAATPLAQRLVQNRIQNLFGSGPGGISLQKDRDGSEFLECSYFTQPIRVPIKVLQNGAIVLQPTGQKAIVYNDLNFFLNGIPRVFFLEAEVKDASLKTELLEKWINTHLDRAIRRKKEELGIHDKIVNIKSLEAIKEELLQFLIEQHGKKNFIVAKLAFCFDSQQLLNDKDFQACFRDVGNLWVDMLSNVEIKNEKHGLLAKPQLTAYIQLPMKWKEYLREKTSSVISKYSIFNRFF